MGENASNLVVPEQQLDAALKSVLRDLLEPAARLEVLRRKELLTDDEVEDLYGINAGTLGNMRREGRGPKCIRMGKTVRYRHQDLEHYIAARQVRTYDQQH